MRLSEFHYDLHPSRIAQEPITPRDHAKLMVLDRQTGRIVHTFFYEIGESLKPGDVLVTNATKVFPARLRGKKKTGGKVEVLLLNPVDVIPAEAGPPPGWRARPPAVWRTGIHHSKMMDPRFHGDDTKAEAVWKALVRGATRASELVFPEGLEARMVERSNEGEWSLAFTGDHLREYLDRHGEMPLPPYIRRPRSQASDVQRYQTVYAKEEGAVAAPTAGFHFTPELLAKIRAKGVIVQSIVLHVGWGTFRPVRTENIERHKMLPEHYIVSKEAARELNKARQEGRRIIAVGTTAVRTLETIRDSTGTFQPGEGQADLFIYPGYRFKAVDALITNFHLPDSTPLLLACAFYAVAGPHPLPTCMSGEGEAKPRVRAPFSLKFAYEEAIHQNYRFYSYGDAMFIQ